MCRLCRSNWRCHVCNGSKQPENYCKTLDGVIRPSDSPWEPPVVLAEKDGSLCFCVYYRMLNHVRKKDVYPLPHIDDSQDRLQNACYFSSTGLKTVIAKSKWMEETKRKTHWWHPTDFMNFRFLPLGCSQHQRHSQSNQALFHLNKEGGGGQSCITAAGLCQAPCCTIQQCARVT